jgi:hypothetical protein
MEFLKELPNSIGAWAAAITVALITIAANLPRIRNGITSDKIDGNVLDRLKRHEERMDAMDKTIHRQAVKLTRFEVVVLRLIALLVQHQVTIPQDIQDEIDELTQEKD